MSHRSSQVTVQLPRSDEQKLAAIQQSIHQLKEFLVAALDTINAAVAKQADDLKALAAVIAAKEEITQSQADQIAAGLAANTKVVADAVNPPAPPTDVAPAA